MGRGRAAKMTGSNRRSRRGEGAIGGVAAVLLVLLAAAAYVVYAWFPVYWDFMAVKEISLTTVRDWSNHNSEKKAKARFAAELKRKDVSVDITPDVCKFIDRKGVYELECNWTMYAYYPGTSYYKAFDAWVHATHDAAQGDLSPG